MPTYKVISGSVQYGRTADKRRMVADIGETLSDKQIGAASAARLVHLGVLQQVGSADVIDVEAKVVSNKKAPVKAAETKQPEAVADTVPEDDVPAFLSGT